MRWRLSRMGSRRREFTDSSGEHYREPSLDIDVGRRDGYDLVTVRKKVVSQGPIVDLSQYVLDRTSPDRGLIIDFKGVTEADTRLPSELVAIHDGRRKGFCVSGLNGEAEAFVKLAGKKVSGLWKVADVHFLRSVKRAIKYFEKERKHLYQ